MSESDIYSRLNHIDKQIAAMSSDIKWLKGFAVAMFGAGGLVGAAISAVVMMLNRGGA